MHPHHAKDEATIFRICLVQPGSHSHILPLVTDELNHPVPFPPNRYSFNTRRISSLSSNNIAYKSKAVHANYADEEAPVGQTYWTSTPSTVKGHYRLGSGLHRHGCL
jgi:hypothetical protein